MPPAPKAVVVSAARGADRAAFCEAAYRLIDRAFVRIEDRRGSLVAVLLPRSVRTSGLSADFKLAYRAAAILKSRHQAARTQRAAILSRALELSERVDARRAEVSPTLPPERLSEIAALLAEDDAAPRDPLGLRTPWNERAVKPRQ